jgi:hypothetical protein
MNNRDVQVLLSSLTWGVVTVATMHGSGWSLSSLSLLSNREKTLDLELSLPCVQLLLFPHGADGLVLTNRPKVCPHLGVAVCLLPLRQIRVFHSDFAMWLWLLCKSFQFHLNLPRIIVAGPSQLL